MVAPAAVVPLMVLELVDVLVLVDDVVPPVEVVVPPLELEAAVLEPVEVLVLEAPLVDALLPEELELDALLELPPVELELALLEPLLDELALLDETLLVPVDVALVLPELLDDEDDDDDDEDPLEPPLVEVETTVKVALAAPTSAVALRLVAVTLNAWSPALALFAAVTVSVAESLASPRTVTVLFESDAESPLGKLVARSMLAAVQFVESVPVTVAA